MKPFFLIVAILCFIGYLTQRFDFYLYGTILCFVCLFLVVVIEARKEILPNQPKGDSVVKGTPGANKVSK